MKEQQAFMNNPLKGTSRSLGRFQLLTSFCFQIRSISRNGWKGKIRKNLSV